MMDGDLSSAFATLPLVTPVVVTCALNGGQIGVIALVLIAALLVAIVGLLVPAKPARS